MDPKKEKKVQGLVEARKALKRNFIKNSSMQQLLEFVGDPESTVNLKKTGKWQLDHSMLDDDYQFESSIASIKR